ncbi:MAG: tyrosine-type recombinase/integrase [Alphaproteobacteria bacterium]
MSKLTKQSIDAARYRGDGKGRDVRWDHVVRGLGVRVYPSGRKAFVLSYRTGARKRLMALGAYGVLTLDEARTEAKKKFKLVLDGKDPLREREARNAEKSVADLAERFLVEHVEPKRRASTAGDYRSILKRLVYPAIGNLRLSDVTRADVAKVHGALVATPRQANYALAILSAFFSWCERLGYRADGTNPCRHVERFPERRRERFLSSEEFARLARAVIDAERDGTETKSALAAILLLAFTGARLSEVLTLKWEHVDTERAMLFLPDSKTGRKVVYLNAPALAVLDRVERVAGNPYVIVGRRIGGPLTDLEKPWQRIRRAAGLDDVRLHDLRHSYASIGAAGGQGLPVLGKLLGHRVAATTQRYAHLGDDPVARAAEAIGTAIDTAMKTPIRSGRLGVDRGTGTVVALRDDV